MEQMTQHVEEIPYSDISAMMSGHFGMPEKDMHSDKPLSYDIVSHPGFSQENLGFDEKKQARIEKILREYPAVHPEMATLSLTKELYETTFSRNVKTGESSQQYDIWSNKKFLVEKLRENLSSISVKEFAILHFITYQMIQNYNLRVFEESNSTSSLNIEWVYENEDKELESRKDTINNLINIVHQLKCKHDFGRKAGEYVSTISNDYGFKQETVSSSFSAIIDECAALSAHEKSSLERNDDSNILGILHRSYNNCMTHLDAVEDKIRSGSEKTYIYPDKQFIWGKIQRLQEDYLRRIGGINSKRDYLEEKEIRMPYFSEDTIQ